jgi:Meckel syndrome type 1 protein
MPHNYTEEEQRQYDEAAAALDAAATPATTARGDDGRFATAAPAAPAAAPAAEGAQASTPAPAAAEKPADPPAAAPGAAPAKPVDELADLKARLERTEKIARDNQAWATKAAQEAAALRKAQEQRDREAAKPPILDANPELADAIRYVAGDPAPQHQAAERAAAFQSTIEKAHPDAFSTDMPEELQQSIAKAWTELGDAAQDPLEVVRVITQEKLAFTERQVGKRFAAEAARQQEKSAMSVPGAGASSVARAPEDTQLAEVKRIQNMSDADFAKEVRRVKGY